jgi:hypothetical protein
MLSQNLSESRKIIIIHFTDGKEPKIYTCTLNPKIDPLRVTTDYRKVTCKRCLKKMARLREYVKVGILSPEYFAKCDLGLETEV